MIIDFSGDKHLAAWANEYYLGYKHYPVSGLTISSVYLFDCYFRNYAARVTHDKETL